MRAAKESELVKVVRAEDEEEKSGEGVGLLEGDEVGQWIETTEGVNKFE